MEAARQLDWLSMAAALSLLAVPIAFSLWLRLGIVRETLVAVARMTIQLVAAGLLLKYLFHFDRPLLNLLWLAVMMLVASLTTVQKSRLRLASMLIPVCLSTFGVTLAFTLFFNTFIVRLDQLFEARYLVVVGGMLLGNTLSANIVGLSRFFHAIDDHESRYLYRIGNGATRAEAVRPFFQEAMIAALKPALASVATMGLVALPGMMTGQILGGSPPMLAIRYQIAIMMAIFATQVAATAFSIGLSRRVAFDEWGVLRRAIFREGREKWT